MKKITALGAPVVAAAALAIGGAGSADAGSVCAYNTFHITKRHHVSCKTAKKVLKRYINSGVGNPVPGYTKWKCPTPYNDQLGKCKKNSETSFRYKSNY